MSRLYDVFKKRRVVLPVIHVENLDQTRRNVELARSCGVDGVFLINHDVNVLTLLSIYTAIKSAYPDFWVGLNCLGTKYKDLVRALPTKVEGIWVDNAGIEDGVYGHIKAKQHMEQRQKAWLTGLYFGGVAFKYQPKSIRPVEHAVKAVPYVDVVTTSGEGTGLAPDISKIRGMKTAISRHPLAVASGITPENVEEYLPYVDCFLVATGVSISHTELSRSKLQRLMEEVYRPR